ncbi:MAG: MFS transporter, partial [Gemmatimonadota bacterium]|nr:MFS transporter [Gemmatimonadota bacterium]
MARSRVRVHRTVIALCCTMLQMCLGTVYAWSFFQTMLARQYGWNNTETVLSFCLAIFFLGISAGWAGQMLPKWGPRVLALTGSVLFCAGYVIASLALQLDNVTLFYLGYGVIGGAGIGMGYVTPVVTVAKWFPDMRGLATGIVVMGFGVGALLLSKVLAPFLVVRADSDLATVFLWLGIVFACILIPCSLMLRNPEEEPAAKARGPARAAKPPAETESARPYLFTGRFAVMWLVFFFNIAAGISVISFQSELLQEVWGLSDPSLEPAVLAEYGATLIAVSSVCNGVGRILWAWLSDRSGRVPLSR